MAYETDITVLGGLPVTIEYTVARPEPDVGYWGGVDDWEIVAIAGKPCKKAPKWLYKRIDETKGETDRIVEALNDDADY